MGAREKKIEKYLAEQVKKIGGVSRKYVSPGFRGVPDRICFFDHTIVFVEVKTPEGVLSKMQEREINMLSKFHLPVAVVRSTEEVDCMISDIKKLLETYDGHN